MKFKKLKRSKKNLESPAKIELAYNVLYPKKNKPHIKKIYPRSQQQCPQRQPRSTICRQPQASSQRVWRKTIVFTKTKPKMKLPRLFRADRLTGLPVDYERTVSKIMHYVNPHLSSSPSPDQLMEELLTRTLVGYVGNWNCSNQSPQFLKHHMRIILRNQVPQSIENDFRNDADLCQFHCACKRKPVPPEALIPTYKSKFNYNNLKIKSK
ncbi:uncharacterized protein LOC117781001 [Drosophila innubila]|uniref:uncharacterized protein LOC117781001 n=1 Tax=Drosophila innubila TaxID=198719 RepID=UPI00148C13EC|nr:uncharacterized protein LOC117781001 [Drosophila innubila]